jgi:hypothetical protein
MKPKLSEMLLKVAEGYIALGEDVEDRRQLLYGAVSAWNIACLSPSSSDRALKKFMTGYRKMNPTQTLQDFVDVEQDMRELIRRKCLMFPDVNAQIVNANLEEIGGKMHVTVASVQAQEK